MEIIHIFILSACVQQLCKKTLALPFQLMQHGTQAELTPKSFPTIDGDRGTQSFNIDGQSYPLEFYGHKLCVKISKPAQECYETLSSYEINSSQPFSPEIDKHLKPRRISNKKIRVLHRRLDKIQESSGFLMSE